MLLGRWNCPEVGLLRGAGNFPEALLLFTTANLGQPKNMNGAGPFLMSGRVFGV